MLFLKPTHNFWATAFSSKTIIRSVCNTQGNIFLPWNTEYAHNCLQVDIIQACGKQTHSTLYIVMSDRISRSTSYLIDTHTQLNQDLLVSPADNIARSTGNKTIASFV